LVWIQNATLDSFDSGLAPYNALTAGSEADVFSNGTMTLQKTTIKGDAGAAGAITLNNGPVVSGTTTPNAPAETPYDIIACSACGTPTDPSKGNYWGVTGGADAFFSVYAPNHVVYALGNSAFYGAVISSIFYITGSAQFHYDEALARKASPNLQVQRATWGQFAGN